MAKTGDPPAIAASAEDLLEFSESMTVEEVSVWLEGKGIPRKYCDAFKGTCRLFVCWISSSADFTMSIANGERVA